MVVIPFQPKLFKTPWRLVIVFCLLAIGIGLTGYRYYERQKQHIKREKQNELLAITNLKVSQIDNWRKERLGDAEIFSRNPLFVQHFQQWLKTGGMSEFRQEILSWMESLLRSYSYTSVFLLDTRGKERLSVNEGKESVGSYAETLAIGAIHVRSAVFADLFREEITQPIHLDLLVPLLLKGVDAVPVGVLLLRTDPHQFLYPLIQSWPIPSRTAESLLVRREGNEVVFLNELRHQKNVALSLRVPVGEQQVPAAMVVRGIEGVVEGVDYRGVHVLAAVKAIPDSPWYLIAKVDREEIYAPIREQARLVIILMGVLISAAGVSIGLFWRRQVAQFYRKQYEGELERRALAEHYEFLKKYANDIILLPEKSVKSFYLKWEL